MSRIGKLPIVIPSKVSVEVDKNNVVTVKGPKGELTRTFNSNMQFNVEGNEVTVVRPDDQKTNKMLHGTTRALLNNMVVGVSEGYAKELELVGIGFRAAVKGNKLTMQVGYSHASELDIPEGITVTCGSATDVKVEGIDKQLVGEFAADIRAVRKPEPYKGKGVRYVGEVVRKKAGKAAGK